MERQRVSSLTPLDPTQVNPEDFAARTLDDEIRVDELCSRLLLAIRDRLTASGHPPLDAGELCRGADYFLRDFIIAECRDNPLRLPPERVRQFAGHWYIVRTLEPNIAELAALLAGIAACYRVLGDLRLIAPEAAAAIAAACAETGYYQQRIEEFWAIEGDGFDRWRSACPLPALQS